jgi:hypothetical protein
MGNGGVAAGTNAMKTARRGSREISPTTSTTAFVR